MRLQNRHPQPQLGAALPLLLLAHAIIGAPAHGAKPLPKTIHLTGVIRDVRASNEAGGHPDFQTWNGSAGVRIGLVQNTLGPDGTPVFKSVTGAKLAAEFKDSAGRNINPGLYDPLLFDTAGTLQVDGQKRITSAASFATWFEDVPGLNLAAPVTIPLKRQGNSSTYVFDSASNQPYKSLRGFFPINGQLLGNYSGTWPPAGPTGPTNFHYTYQLAAGFTYDKDDAQVFTFRGDDDVWVFIDGKLVIDLGGIHAPREQSIALDRLGLQDGKTYRLDFFFAERNIFESNIRVETNFILLPGGTVSVSGTGD